MPCRERSRVEPVREGARPNLTRDALSGGIPRQLSTSDSLGRTLAPGLAGVHAYSLPRTPAAKDLEPALFLRARKSSCSFTQGPTSAD
jgi:hypothetical protein